MTRFVYVRGRMIVAGLSPVQRLPELIGCATGGADSAKSGDDNPSPFVFEVTHGAAF